MTGGKQPGTRRHPPAILAQQEQRAGEVSYRYRFLGDKLSDPTLVGQRCEPVRRADGCCIVSLKFATALVDFEDGSRRVVPRRRLRVLRQPIAVDVGALVRGRA